MISITMFGRCGEERKERGAGKRKGYEARVPKSKMTTIGGTIYHVGDIAGIQ